MRNLDNHIVYTIDGKPFNGRFTFFKLHTTEKVVITDESGEELDNPMLTDIEGRTAQQVFLPDEDITVMLEKYIGGGNMSDDMDNISSWSEAMTFDSLKNTTVISTGDGIAVAATVGTMAELRNVNIAAVNYAILLGYYELGDMPPQYYKLLEDRRETDNGGSIVRVDTDHIWKMVPQQIIDCRSFGVFPSDSAATAPAYNSQLRYCFSYAKELGNAVFMPNLYAEGSYYLLEGGAHELTQTLYLGTGAHLSGKTGTSSTLVVDEIVGAAEGFLYANLQLNTGNLTLTVKKARASWMNTWANGFLDINATEEFIIDKNIGRSKTFQNLQKVTIAVQNFSPGGTMTFDNIQEFLSPSCISLNAMIVFRNMTRVSDSWFAVDNTHRKLDLTRVSCDGSNTLIPHDFKFIENYTRMAYNNGVRSFNLEGRALPPDFTFIYENCSFTNGEIDTTYVKGNLVLKDITASLYSNSIITNVEMDTVNFTGSFPYSTSGSVYVRNCSFKASNNAMSTLPFFHGSSCVVKDSLFSGYLLQAPYNAVITGCTFDAVSASGYKSSIDVYGNATNFVSVTFSDNILMGGKLTIRQSTAQYLITVQNSVFVGNSITDSTDGTNFIKWAGGSMAPTGHTYVYKNNDGPGVLQTDDYASFIRLIPMIPEGATPTTSKYVTYGEPWRDPDHSEYVDMWYRKYKVYGITMADFNLFAFGNDDYANKYAEWTFSCQENSQYPNDMYWGSESHQSLSIKNSGCNRNGIGAMSAANIPNPWETTASYNNAVDTMHIVTPPAYCDIKIKVEIFDARVTT